MKSHIYSVPDSTDLRQGDLICRKIAGDSLQFGVIINADCDIAQSRNSGHITWVEVVPASTYIDKVWSWERARKLFKKQSAGILQQVNAAVSKADAKLRKLEWDDLCRWLVEASATEVCEQINLRDDKALERLIALEQGLKIGNENFDFQALTRLCDPFGTNANKLLEEAQEHLGRTADFPDFVLVPGVPSQMERAFLVMLRHIMGWKQDSIYTSEAAALINDDRDAFYRIGRFEDTLRFQIVQKLSFLFLRIGSSTAYEGDCEAVLDLMTTEILGKLGA